jgi:hypothetical protein
MYSTIVLFAPSLLISFAFGRFSWHAIAIFGLALAVLAAVVLHRQGFGPFDGIAIIVACLARLHQLRGLGDAKILKSLGHSPKGRHYRG